MALTDSDAEPSACRAAILALAEFDEDRLPATEREQLAPRLADLYRDDPDPGIHAATGWLLHRWGQGSGPAEMDRPRANGRPGGPRSWYVNSRGQTMVIIPPGVYQRGLKGLSRGRVDHRFALAAREVTVAEFRQSRRDFVMPKGFAPSEDCPVHMVSWYEAAAYCNWLSEQDGIPKAQWCYTPNEQGEYAEGMRIVPDALSRSGYRLPTAAEWEYACRAGSGTTWSPGEAQDLLPKYAWHVSNSWSRLHPVGTLRPNDWGLFDMHGNAWEWCQDGGKGQASGAAGRRRYKRRGTGHAGWGLRPRPADYPVLAFDRAAPTDRGGDMGFRPARTVP